MEESQWRFSRFIEWFYYTLAAVGLCGTWSQFPRMPYNGFLNATKDFWLDVISRPASLFLTVDLLVLSSVVFVWMFGEARRHRIRFVWLYFLGALFIAISFFVPLFMGVRQRRLRASMSQGDMPLDWSDWIAIAIAVASSLAAVAYSVGTLVHGAP